ncbi:MULTISPECIES: carboxymuconolactone decarboxylase family protein [unclassified Chelatococcus]|uniref:carboxymuconolactone decarboxylase family protein n=1 Tax=unclassified Chelatococcus TaxID=2638111 RepID=UPI001BCAA828|nr:MULTISPECIES: carboxymuconolactone decarboxylase family protein [unclassified Chelatococcus]MBX3321249.1 carboxymuconolactone decarboxylase family protein [Nitrospira sp.]CAH1664810.1 4-carboxymuconolactone decarboxylase [Hyphomicrobiales bacterium]MBS7743748.1 carboxymuconolactone decarboxylase family protein [Chelatococcus sp. HY11]MBX3547441.1 carboxymuconolactone decarboxylase family protein [Chelatococcus sp.]CAH1688549.1 4-carboxymuconolactone decarboxylase [Hyphomicrobiales bacterium
MRRLIGENNYRERSEHVRSFGAELQEVAEQFVFEEVWMREGLDWRSRSLLCLGALTARGMWRPLRLHLHGAFNNGLTETEIREAIIHLAVYCGFPNASEANHVVEQVLAERRRPEPDAKE